MIMIRIKTIAARIIRLGGDSEACFINVLICVEYLLAFKNENKLPVDGSNNEV